MCACTNQNISTDGRTRRYPGCIYSPRRGYRWHASPGGCCFRFLPATGRLTDHSPALVLETVRFWSIWSNCPASSCYTRSTKADSRARPLLPCRLLLTGREHTSTHQEVTRQRSLGDNDWYKHLGGFHKEQIRSRTVSTIFLLRLRQDFSDRTEGCRRSRDRSGFDFRWLGFLVIEPDGA